MQARYYDPIIGRFLSNDPVPFTPQRLQMFNRYSYTENNPVNNTDPNGMYCIPCIPPAIAALGEAAAWVGAAIFVGATEQQISKMAEHTKGKRPSTKGKHEKGKATKAKSRGGEKGDSRRRPNRRRPDGHKGPWPPKDSTKHSSTTNDTADFSIQHQNGTMIDQMAEGLSGAIGSLSKDQSVSLGLNSDGSVTATVSTAGSKITRKITCAPSGDNKVKC